MELQISLNRVVAQGSEGGIPPEGPKSRRGVPTHYPLQTVSTNNRQLLDRSTIFLQFLLRPALLYFY